MATPRRYRFGIQSSSGRCGFGHITSTAMTTYAVPDASADPEAAALDLIVRLPAVDDCEVPAAMLSAL